MSFLLLLIIIVLIDVHVIMNESVSVVFIWEGVVVEDAVAIIRYEIGISHLFSGLKVDIHCEGKPVR